MTKSLYVLDVGPSRVRAGTSDGVTTTLIAERELPDVREAGDRQSDQRALLGAIEAVLADVTTSGAPAMGALAVTAPGIMERRSSPAARDWGPLRDEDVHVISVNVVGLKDQPLQARLEQLFGVRVHLENDVNALALAVPVEDAVVVMLGTGLGATVKRGGAIQRVQGTWSCYEIGHGFRMVLPDDLMRKCRCGAIGCLEAAIGAWALGDRFGVAPADAPPMTQARMMSSVLDLLPVVVASFLDRFGVDCTLIAGDVAAGFQRHADFTGEFARRVRRRREGSDVAEVNLLSGNAEMAAHGAAAAALAAGILSH